MPSHMMLSRLLVSIIDFSRRRAVWVVLASLILAVLCGWLAAARLGVSTDTDALFSPDLPWRQQAMAMDREFPQFRDLLVAVIDAAYARSR